MNQKLFVLELDERGVYQGRAREVAADDIKPGDVALDHLPDNPPGRYRWDGAALMPIPPAQRDSDTPPPAALGAIAIGFIAQWAAGAVLPGETLDWLRFYVSSLDFAGSVKTHPSRDLVARFIKEESTQ